MATNVKRCFAAEEEVLKAAALNPLQLKQRATLGGCIWYMMRGAQSGLRSIWLRHSQLYYCTQIRCFS